MTANAYILDWTMNQYDDLQRALEEAGFAFAPEGNTAHIRVTVPLARVMAFADLCRPHLNAPQNYVDVQFPDAGRTMIIFREQVFTITDAETNATVRDWALARGLPPEQADWPTSFETE